jgi:hypothetical protein
MSKSSSVNIPKDYTMKIGGDGTTIQVDSDLDNIHIKEIPALTVNSNLAVTQPIVTKSDSTAGVDLKIEPVKADVTTNSTVDLKPVAMDSCQTIKLAPLPPIRVEQPYSQHFGITFMGMELWGITVSGKSEMFLHSPPKPSHYSMQVPEHHGPCKEQVERPDPPRPRSGIRVRIGGQRES